SAASGTAGDTASPAGTAADTAPQAQFKPVAESPGAFDFFSSTHSFQATAPKQSAPAGYGGLAIPEKEPEPEAQSPPVTEQVPDGVPSIVANAIRAAAASHTNLKPVKDVA